MRPRFQTAPVEGLHAGGPVGTPSRHIDNRHAALAAPRNKKVCPEVLGVFGVDPFHWCTGNFFC